MKMKIYGFKKGFGILEVLVSAVIVITILAALVLIGRAALANSINVQEKAQAIYLAQEGIEQVRQIRDTNWIDKNNATQFDDLVWDGNKIVEPTNNTDYVIDSVSIDATKQRMLLVALQQNSATVSLKDSKNNATKEFQRTIKINYLNYPPANALLPGTGSNDVQKATEAYRVTVFVSWNANGMTKSVTASEILTNWRPNF